MVKVAVQLPADAGDAGELIADARALEAAGADTMWLPATSPAHWLLVGAVAALTQRIRLGITEAGANTAAMAALKKISGGRVVTGVPPDERWVAVPVPPDRAGWARTIREQEEAGVTGVIVLWDPRLIDLLRNPEPDDRSDLLMSTG